MKLVIYLYRTFCTFLNHFLDIYQFNELFRVQSVSDSLFTEKLSTIIKRMFRGAFIAIKKTPQKTF